MILYPHEVTLGVQHAGVDRVVAVVQGDNVKAHSLRHGQDHGEHPYGDDLYGGEKRDPYTLHPAPRGHRSVPGRTDGRHGRQGINNDNWETHLKMNCLVRQQMI